MAPMTTTIATAFAGIGPYRLLPDDRRDWSSDEQDSYREVLAELDTWSRRHDAPRSLNSWIAEEAVRRSV